MIHQRRPFMLVIIALGTLACFLACGTTGSIATGHTPTPTVTSIIGGTATAGSTPSATAGPATSCASLIGSGTAASAGASFADVAFPTGSVSSAITPHSSGTGLWSISLFNACSPATNVNAVQSFFATQLPTQGWAAAPTLPFDGGYQAPCGDPYCWSKDTAPRYVGLENVAAAGGGFVTYRIRLFVPPPAPASCTASQFANLPYHATWWSDTAIPLPPLSLSAGPGDGYSDSTESYSFSYICSAGTMSSINLFMQTEMTRLGYHTGTLPCTTGTFWVNGHRGVTWDGSDPTGWQVSEHVCA